MDIAASTIAGLPGQVDVKTSRVGKCSRGDHDDSLRGSLAVVQIKVQIGAITIVACPAVSVIFTRSHVVLREGVVYHVAGSTSPTRVVDVCCHLERSEVNVR